MNLKPIIVFFAATILMLSCGNTGKVNSVAESGKENAGTVTVDVRTVQEWNEDGHADCSINIPLDQLPSRVSELRKYEKIRLVCRSGNRAGTAQQILSAEGITNTENLGSWKNIQCKD